MPKQPTQSPPPEADQPVDPPAAPPVAPPEVGPDGTGKDPAAVALGRLGGKKGWPRAGRQADQEAVVRDWKEGGPRPVGQEGQLALVVVPVRRIVVVQDRLLAVPHVVSEVGIEHDWVARIDGPVVIGDGIHPQERSRGDRPDAVRIQDGRHPGAVPAARAQVPAARRDVRDRPRRGQREATTRAEAIENAVFDLKAVNPNRASSDDLRTPEELLTLIEDKGWEADAALGRLRQLLNVVPGPDADP